MAEMTTEVERLIRRATPLLFGIFGQSFDHDGNRIVQQGGSGIFVAQFLGLTARHVSQHFFRLDGRRDAPPARLYETQYGASLFQLHDPFGGRRQPLTAMWQAHHTWDSQVTDITLVHVSAESGHALDLQAQMPTRFFEWSLLSPPVGTRVTMLGFPETTVTSEEGQWSIEGGFVLQEATVDVVFKERRDRGMLNFPCFALNMHAEGGFSGGPVFHEGRLCGIVSSSTTYDTQTYVASLWPMCLMEYDAGFGGKTSFADLFDRGVIVAHDWRELRGRYEKRFDEGGKPYAYLSPSSA
jgi:hypothetical protein